MGQPLHGITVISDDDQDDHLHAGQGLHRQRQLTYSVGDSKGATATAQLSLCVQ